MSSSILLDKESIEVLEKCFRRNSLAMAVSSVIRKWVADGMPGIILGRAYNRDNTVEWRTVRFTIEDDVMASIRRKYSYVNLSESIRNYLSTFI